MSSGSNVLRDPRYSPKRRSRVVILDLTLFSAAAVISYFLRTVILVPGHPIYPFRVYIPFFAILVGSWITFVYIFGLYGSDGDEPFSLFRLLARVNYYFIVLVSVAAFVLRVTTTNRILLVLFVLLGNIVIVITHGLPLLKRSRSYAILGTDAIARNTLKFAGEYFRLRDATFGGFLAPSSQDKHFFVDHGLPLLGSMEDGLLNLSNQIDCIIVALPSDYPDTRRVLEDLQSTGLNIVLAYPIPESVELVAI